jgi:hypothetical protein
MYVYRSQVRKDVIIYLENLYTFYDMLVINIFFKYAPLRARALDTGLASRGREKVTPEHKARNFFLLMSIILHVVT